MKVFNKDEKDNVIRMLTSKDSGDCDLAIQILKRKAVEYKLDGMLEILLVVDKAHWLCSDPATYYGRGTIKWHWGSERYSHDFIGDDIKSLKAVYARIQEVVTIVMHWLSELRLAEEEGIGTIADV